MDEILSEKLVPVGGHAWGNNLDWFFFEESLGAIRMKVPICTGNDCSRSGKIENPFCTVYLNKQ